MGAGFAGTECGPSPRGAPWAQPRETQAVEWARGKRPGAGPHRGEPRLLQLLQAARGSRAAAAAPGGRLARPPAPAPLARRRRRPGSPRVPCSGSAGSRRAGRCSGTGGGLCGRYRGPEATAPALRPYTRIDRLKAAQSVLDPRVWKVTQDERTTAHKEGSDLASRKPGSTSDTVARGDPIPPQGSLTRVG